VKNIHWYSNIDLDIFYDPDLCRKTIKNFMSKDITKAICGICIANCPYTQKYINKNSHITNRFS
jgi:epoxyqueuosine reductase QueG